MNLLLYQDDDLRINRQGFLSKTGGDRTGWKKRFCALTQDGFKYYKDESVSVCSIPTATCSQVPMFVYMLTCSHAHSTPLQCSEELGTINTGDMLSVAVIDDDSLTQGSAKSVEYPMHVYRILDLCTSTYVNPV